ncbi:MAG: TrmH family RNA methyltransferase [Nocardioidaceae bacterium]
MTPRSARVKAARRLARRHTRTVERAFLAEGPQALREALSVPGCVSEVFATYDGTTRHPAIQESALAQEVPWLRVDEPALSSLAQTVSPQGLVARCRFVDQPLTAALAGAPSLVVICANVRDPGNAGTVIRCADAAGADAVVLAGESVDPYNGKAVRASVGSLFHLPTVIDVTADETVEAVRGVGCTVLAADGQGEVSLDGLMDSGKLSEPSAWLFGNEAWGLSSEVAGRADHVVRVPIYGRAESLNLAAAAAVCLYASARAQR